MLIEIKIVELSKKPLPIIYKGKKRIYYQLKSRGLTAYKKLKKERPSRFKKVSSKTLIF